MPRPRPLSIAPVALLVAWLLGLVFLWAYPALPFQDLIAHAAFIAARARFAHSPVERALLVYWPQLGPYSLFQALGGALSALLGPLAAVRMIASAVWTSYPLAMAYARRRLEGSWSSASAFVGMALALGLMTMLGLASFQLAGALLLVVNAEWIVLLRGGSFAPIRLARFAPLPLLLFWAHGYAFAMFTMLACVAWLVQRPRRSAKPWLAVVPGAAMAALAAGAAFFRAIPGAAVPTGSPTLRFQGPLQKLELLVTPTLLTRWGIDAALSLGMWLFAACFCLRGMRREGFQRTLAWQAGCLLLAFVLAPHAIGAFGFVDARLLPSVIALAWLARDARREPPALHIAAELCAPAATFVLLGCGLLASWWFQGEAEGNGRVASAIPSGSRLLHLPLDPDSAVFAAHPFLHYDKLALIDRPLIVSDVWFHQATALYPRAEHPALRLPTGYRYSVLGEARWNEYRWEDWDFVLVRTRPGAEEPRGIPARLARIEHVGGFWLYRVEKPE